ncbi:MAG: YicC family protein [Planctomycetes bacterium]|nr:YicC family protein [Planctomycetota bacterium]
MKKQQAAKIRSMTGYGRGVAQIGDAEASVEISATNHRYVNVNFRSRANIDPHTSELEKTIKSKIGRGSLLVRIRFAGKDSSEASIRKDVLERYIAQVEELRLEQPRFFDKADGYRLLRLPGVCSETDEGAPLSEDEVGAMFAALSNALGALNVVREKEGESLLTDLSTRIDSIEASLADVRAIAKEAVTIIRDKLVARVNALLEDAPAKLDSSDLAKEIALIADKGDIEEEITRLAHHLTDARGTLASAGDCGRRLEFIFQEMLREANTIASKQLDVRIVKKAIDIKTEVERLREQIQNVE